MFSRSIFKNPTLPASPPLRFPQKLWKIANECKSGAVCWSPDGKSILLRYSLFRNEFMSAKGDLFKTDNISSFVRQLNLYGFRKVYDHAHKQAYKANTDLHEFSNTYFQRDRPDLLDKVTRKSGILKERNDLWPDSLKPMDFSDESSCDKQEGPNASVEVNDHSYLLTEKTELSKDDHIFNNAEEKVIKISQPIRNIEIKQESTSPVLQENRPEEAAQVPEIPDQNTPVLPVKKKRGRKPGSKRNQPLTTKFCDSNLNIYYSPILKYPEKYPSVLYFNDEDDRIFLRNTSRDVMLSSTLPFQETTEYLELKETYHRLFDSKRKLRYGLLPLNGVSLPIKFLEPREIEPSKFPNESRR